MGPGVTGELVDEQRTVSMVHQVVEVRATPERVWERLTGPDHVGAWWRPGVVLEAVEGGEFAEPWRDLDGIERTTRGRVEAVETGQMLRLSWRDEDWPTPTTVTVRLVRIPRGTRVIVDHSGFERLPNADAMRHAHAHGWRRHLQALRSYVEQGVGRGS